MRKTVLGSDLGVEETDEEEEVDDPLVTRAPSKGKGKDVGADDETETDTAGMADDDVAFSSSSLRSRPRQRVRPSSWPSSPVIASASDTITIGASPLVISLNTEFPDESTSPAASSSTSTTTYLLQAGAFDPTVELTPPTPAPHSTPLPLPQTLLLNPYAGSLLTTHHPKSSKRRSLPAGSSPRTLTPTPTTRTRTPLHLPKTLVLDLDETLIHSTARAPNNSYGQGLFSAGGLGFGSGNGGVGFGIWGGKKMGPGHMVEVVLGGRSTLYHVYKRPFVDYFLRKVWWHMCLRVEFGQNLLLTFCKPSGLNLVYARCFHCIDARVRGSGNRLVRRWPRDLSKALLPGGGPSCPKHTLLAGSHMSIINLY